MTDAEKLIIVRTMIDGDADDMQDSDAVLLTYLHMAGQKIINRAYPYRDDVTEVPAKYEFLQCEAAAYMLNKRGAEGQLSHSENGISRSYADADLPSHMLSQIVQFVGVM